MHLTGQKNKTAKVLGAGALASEVFSFCFLVTYDAKNAVSVLVSSPDPTSREEKGLVTVERFLGCAE